MAEENIFRLDLGHGETKSSGAAVQSASGDPTTFYPLPLDLPSEDQAQAYQPIQAQAPAATSGVVVTEMIATPAVEDRRRLVLWGLGLTLVACAAALFLMADPESDSGPMDRMMAMFSPESSVTVAPVPVRKVVEKKVEAAKVASVPENPYWDLPNLATVSESSRNRAWTSSEEAVWRKLIKHRYPYQRYKTVSDIRQYKLNGSEVLLRDALNDKKLWTRMQALFALAEFGVSIDTDMVEKALGNERPALVSNYFKRFERPLSEGEMHVLRHAVKLVDASARLSILKAIAQTNDSSAQLYLVAASYDPGKGVADFAAQRLYEWRVSKDSIKGYRDYITGVAQLPEPVKESVEQSATIANTPVKAEKISSDVSIQNIKYLRKGKAEAVNANGEVVEDSFKKLDIIEIK